HDGPPGVAVVERHGVLPPLPKRELEVADDGPPDLQLEVVPRGPRTVARVEVDGLRVTEVPLVVAPPVAQVDPADEGDVVLLVAPADQDELLVMAPPAPDPLVQQ